VKIIFLTLPSSLRLNTAESLHGTKPLTSAEAMFGVLAKIETVRKYNNQRFIKKNKNLLLLTNYILTL